MSTTAAAAVVVVVKHNVSDALLYIYYHPTHRPKSLYISYLYKAAYFNDCIIIISSLHLLLDREKERYFLRRHFYSLYIYAYYSDAIAIY